MSSSLTLIVLAAGLGSRFGGNKHAAEVGPQGQCLFEYSVSDAIAAGFDHIVFVVSPTQSIDEIQNRLSLVNQNVKIDYAVQSVDTAVGTAQQSKIRGRTKPWGTAHAVLACRHLINNPFALVNADDYYGAENFYSIAQFLLHNQNDPKSAAMSGYLLSNTLSESGAVNRGVCKVSQSNYLESIVEVKNISRSVDQGLHFDAAEQSLQLSDDSVVSMNFWGFQAEIFPYFQDAFTAFISNQDIGSDTEIVIPDVVDLAIAAKALSVKVLPTSALWQGLTHAEDLPAVRKFIAELVQRGDYAQMSRKAM